MQNSRSDYLPWEHIPSFKIALAKQGNFTVCDKTYLKKFRNVNGNLPKYVCFLSKKSCSLGKTCWYF